MGLLALFSIISFAILEFVRIMAIYFFFSLSLFLAFSTIANSSKYTTTTSSTTSPSLSSAHTSLPRLENYVPYNIEDFGAIAGIDTHQQALTNGIAFANAVQAAFNTTNSTRRAVLVPYNKIYSFLPATPSFNNMYDITLFIEGTLNVSTANFSTSFPGWPNPYAVITFTNCSKLSIISQYQKGLINGRGNLWWWYALFIADHRNHLLAINSCTDFILSGLTFLNAPEYHVNLQDMMRVQVYDVTVLVDIEDQLNIYRYLSGNLQNYYYNNEDDSLFVENNQGKSLQDLTYNYYQQITQRINPYQITNLLWSLGYAEELSNTIMNISNTTNFLSSIKLPSSAAPLQFETLSAEEILTNRAYLLAYGEDHTITALRAQDWYQTLQSELLSKFSIPSIPSSNLNPTSIYSAYRVVPPVPMIWALNTDGIDISGIDIIVTNCSITNFDDCVCPKPLNLANSIYGNNCTSNFTITNIDITWGVGVSMGSVPPDVGGDCISNVHTSNVTFTYPLKGVYIKPNPADINQAATGLISDIIYENITMYQPVWWSIWIGTQQEQQPGTAGTGCSFLYPLFNSSCPTDPQVTVQNILLKNIQIYNPVLSTGVLLMNSSNPGTNFIWDNVMVYNVSSFPENNGTYICENIQGTVTNSYPIPSCFTN